MMSLYRTAARIWLALSIICMIAIVQAKKSSKKSSCNADFFSQYRSAAEISTFVDACAEKFDAKTVTIGKSAESKPLKVITIGQGNIEVFVMAGLHGREWIAPAATVWSMHQLMETKDDHMSQFLAKTKVHFLSLVNPDGYDYSRTKSETQNRRQWRKNRRLLPCKGERCAHGVDLNRNWGIEGKTFGFGESRPTSDVFQGKRPFSEPEIKAVRDWLLEGNRGKHIDFVLDIHCCAQNVLPPNYYHGETDALKAEHLAIARAVAKAMTTVNQEQYGFRERETEFSKTNSGISVDWIYGESGVGLALIVETRGNEKDRKLDGIFDVDPEQIPKIGAEVLAAIQAAANEKLSNRVKNEEHREKQSSESIASRQDEKSKPEVITLAPERITDQIRDSAKLEEPELEEEEELPAPLDIEPISARQNDEEEMGAPPPGPQDAAPPNGPGEDEEEHSEAYKRRHHQDEDAPPPIPENEDASSLDDAGTHIESFHPRETDADDTLTHVESLHSREDQQKEDPQENEEELDENEKQR